MKRQDMGQQTNSAQRELDLGLTNMKRNPYLVDYTEYKRNRKPAPQRVSGRPASVRVMEKAASRRTSKGQASGRTRDYQPSVRKQAIASRQIAAGYAAPARYQQTGRPQAAAGHQAQVRRQTQTSQQSPARYQQMGRPQAAARKQLPARYESAARHQQAARRRKFSLLAAALLVICLGGAVLFLSTKLPDMENALPDRETNVWQETDASELSGKMIQGISASAFGKHPTWTEDFLTPNEYSRPGDPLTEVNSIFVHYTANQGTSAAQNRSYFEQLKDTQERSASAHFIIGYEGEIIQCIPLDEIAYAVQTRNEDSVSIECCYLEEDGSFTQETYDSLILLLSWLKDTYRLDTEDILRHYDCGGKKCPLYYTEHEDAWELLKKDVERSGSHNI